MSPQSNKRKIDEVDHRVQKKKVGESGSIAKKGRSSVNKKGRKRSLPRGTFRTQEKTEAASRKEDTSAADVVVSSGTPDPGRRLASQSTERGTCGDEASSSPASGAGTPSAEAIKQCALEMLSERAATSSICPSEVARALGGAGWRDIMEQVRDVGRSLARTGQLRITQVGRGIKKFAIWIGTSFDHEDLVGAPSLILIA